MARRSSLFLFVVGLVSGVWTGCGADSDGDGDGSGDPGADVGGGGGDGGGGGSPDGCEPPAGAEIVMPWTAFPDEDNMTGPCYGLITDGTLLYVNMRDRIVTVPLNGGTATEVFRSPEEIPVLLTMWADTDRIVFNDNGDWYELPYGGAPVPATVPVQFANTIFDFDPATDTFYAADEDFVDDNIDLVSAVVGEATPTVLASDLTVGLGREWVRSGDRFYTQESQNDDFTAGRSVYVINLGDAAPTALELTPPPFNLVGATSAALYYASSEDPSTWGVYRVAHGGGSPERIWDTVFFGGLGGVQSATDRLYGNDATNLWRITDGQDLALIAQVPVQGCTTHEVLAHEGFVYTVTFNDDDGTNQIWRVAE
jgi:hypothetical protein